MSSQTAPPFKPHNKFYRIVQDIGWTTTSTIFLAVAGFFLNILLGNLFNEDGLGLYAMTTTFYLAVGTLVSVGLPNALTKYAAEFGDESTVEQEFFTASLLLTLISSLIGTTILLLLRKWLAIVFNMPDLTGLLTIIAVGLPFFELNKVILARLRGLRQMRFFAIGESARYLFLIGLTVGLVARWRSLEAAVWALALTELLLFGSLWWLTNLPRHISWHNLKERSRKLGWFGNQVLLTRLVVEVDARLDLFLVGYFLTEADVGIYTVALTFALGLKLLPTAFQKATGPVITQTHIQGKVAALEQFVNRSMQGTVFLLTLLAIPLVALFPHLIRLLYPGQDAFLAGQTVFNILVVGLLLRGITGSVGNVFVSIGRPDINFKVAPLRVLVRFIIGVALVGPFGINGIATASAAASILVFILWIAFLPRVADVRVDYKPLLAIPGIGLIALLATYLLSIVTPLLAALTISMIAFSLVTTRFWHFEQYLLRLWPPRLNAKQSQHKSEKQK